MEDLLNFKEKRGSRGGKFFLGMMYRVIIGHLETSNLHPSWLRSECVDVRIHGVSFILTHVRARTQLNNQALMALFKVFAREVTNQVLLIGAVIIVSFMFIDF